MNPPNEDQRQRIEPNAGDWTTTTRDEWAQGRQVAPNGDICEGRRVHERGYNDSHPAPDETTTTSPSTIDWDTDGDGEGEEGRSQGRQAWYDESNPTQHEEVGEEGCDPTEHEDACSPTQREEGGGRVRPNTTRRSANQHDDDGDCSTTATRQRQLTRRVIAQTGG
jgi:hypothetical protein